jgi:hypothetical protein
MLRFAPVAFSPTLLVDLFQEQIKAISAEAFLFASVAGVVQSESENSLKRGEAKSPSLRKERGRLGHPPKRAWTGHPRV